MRRAAGADVHEQEDIITALASAPAEVVLDFDAGPPAPP
eukprot:gene17197-9153_t